MIPASFQGARLQQARIVRELTGAALAERVGVSPPSITSWEHGRTSPRPAASSALARVLELPEAYFLRPIPTNSPEAFRFRSLSAATKRAREAAQVRAQWLHEIAECIGREVELPTVDVPDLGLPSDPNAICREDIERAAMATREAWGLRDGPIPNLIRLLEAHGVVVSRLALNAAQLDGLSGWSADGRPYVVLNIEKASCVRSRFDAAHELGHLVLHRTARTNPDPAIHKLMESQAHHFAGAFIFPASAVNDEVSSASLDELLRLKPRWKLSIGAQVYRLFQLGHIGEHQRHRLHKQMGMRGWRSFEPLDGELPGETPELVRRAYQLLCEEAGWTPADIMREVPIATHDHERLASLPTGWMDGTRTFGQLVKLKVEPSSGQMMGESTDAKIIKFPGAKQPR